MEKEAEKVAAGLSATPQPIPIKLFVRRVPPTCNEEQLKPVFEEFGVVEECQVLKHKETGEHKNSAFVKMRSLSDADRAIRTLNNVKKLDDATGAIQVKYAIGEVERIGLVGDVATPGQDEGTLFIGSIPKTATEESLRPLFEPFGTITSAIILKQPGTNEQKGCGFVKFEKKENALQAIVALNQKKTLEGANRPLDVRFAVSKGKKEGASPVQGSPYPHISTLLANNASLAVATAAHQPPPQAIQMLPRQAGTWREYVTHDGRPYYHNESTQVTQWQAPPEFQMLAAQQQRVTPAAVPTTVGLPQVPNPTRRVAAPQSSGPPGANLFLFHLPNHWRQEDVEAIFAQFGTIIGARLPMDDRAGVSSNKGYAFLSYDQVGAAAKAINSMNGFKVGSKRLKVSVKKGEEDHIKQLLSVPLTTATTP